ncbi:MAG TPA: alpha/beta hydrolase [Solirubrobacteraceae bacterium]|nr:alpha/beta hydrolase [Solirubrobacteraceae bacterium]
MTAGEPPAVTPRRVALDDHETLVLDAGSGTEPFLVIHALGVDRNMARGLLPLLSARRRTIAYDVRLHGEAAADPGSFRLETCAEDARTLLDRLGIERAHVAGFSMGGAIAQHLALRHPERVASLSLLCTMARAPRDVYLERAVVAEREGMEALVVPTLTRWFSDEAVAVDDWPVRYARRCIAEARVEYWAAAWRGLAEIDTLERLGSIAAPTHVIAGEDDRSTSPDQMRQIADRIPGSRFTVIPGAPHLAALELPDAVADAVLG